MLKLSNHLCLSKNDIGACPASLHNTAGGSWGEVMIVSTLVDLDDFSQETPEEGQRENDMVVRDKSLINKERV